MLNKIYSFGAIIIAILAIYLALADRSALVLREEDQSNYVVRGGTRLSGVYIDNNWQPSPSRAEYSEFKGGGLGVGK